MGMKGRGIAVVVLLVVAGAAAVWRVAARTPSRPAGAGPASHRAFTSGERLALLDSSLRAIADGERDAPRDRWDPAYVVEQIGRDPDQLRGWVQASTTWLPYRGVLRGATGVLMDRQGNSLDRAILLASLLEYAGHEVRLANGRLPDDAVAGLLPGLLASTVRQFETPPDSGDGWALRNASLEYGLDPSAMEASLGAQVTAMDSVMRILHVRVARQSRRLLAQVPHPQGDGDSLARADQAAESLKDHWWVQVQQDGAWRDLELLDVPTPAADHVAEPSALPDKLYHTLTVRLVAEEEEGGVRRLVPALEETVRPSAIPGRALALQIWPANMPAELHAEAQSRFGLATQAQEEREWVVALTVADSSIASGVIGGGAAAGSRSARAPSGNPMGGLGGAMAAAAAPKAAGPEVTAAWIEYEVRAPGRPTRTWRRAVFDLVGPAARAAGRATPVAITDAQRLQRGLALIMHTEMLPITSEVAPEYGLHLIAQNALANTTLMRRVAVSDSGSLPDRDSLIALAAPGVSPLYALALARLDWSRVGRWLYVDQIGLLTRHRHLSPAGDMVTVRGAVEIIARDLGVAPGGPDAFTVRLEQGVFDTNAEAMWWGGHGINNTADAFELGGDWALLGTPAAADQLAVHEDARARMREDLAAGLTLVAPRQAVSRGGDHFTGWWRIDPVTGAATGTPANGWAQCGSEYSIHLRVAAEMGKAMLTEFAFCHALAQAANEFKAFVKSFGHLLYTGPIEVLRPRDVAAGVNQGCIKGAIVAGMFATLPFLIIQSHRYAEFGLVEMGEIGPPKPFLRQGPNNTIEIPKPGLPTGPYQPAGFAATEPGLPPVGRGPAGPGNTGPPAPPSRTGPPAPGPRTGPPSRPGTPNPGPSKYPATQAGAQRAREAYEQALVNDREAFNDLMAYRDQYPVNGRWGWQYDHPGFDLAEDTRLADKMMEAHFAKQEAREALNQVNQAIRNAPPPAAPAPAPASGRMAAGMSHAAESFRDSPWDLD
jgi:hypothetical protein